jgi:hypothetical protein
MAQATYNDRCDLNQEEQKVVEDHATYLFSIGAIESYLPLGKKDVCLKRESSSHPTFDVFAMHNTLARNEEHVTRFNKRKKQGH